MSRPVCISFNTNGVTSEWTSSFEPVCFTLERVWAERHRVADRTSVESEKLDVSIYLHDDWLPLCVPLIGYDEWYRYHRLYGEWIDKNNDGEEGEEPTHPGNKLARPLVVDPLRLRLNVPDSRYLTITVEGHTL